jgi:prepilin-type N-terminal cleavage/methylation domain-containing protein
MAMRNRSAQGTTLMELMIVVAILGIVVTVAPTFLKNITRFNNLTTARLETQRSARDSLSQIMKGLHQAQASTIVLSQESSQFPYSSVSFSTIDGRTLKYYQQGNDLKFVSNGSTTTLAKGLRYIAFSYPRTDDDGIISVSLTFEKSTYEGGSKTLQMAIEKVRVMND